MLLAIRDFIQAQGTVSNEQLSREFRIATEALQPMLAFCVAKGLIRLLNPRKSCGSACQSCPSLRIDYYESVKN